MSNTDASNGVWPAYVATDKSSVPTPAVQRRKIAVAFNTTAAGWSVAPGQAWKEIEDGR